MSRYSDDMPKWFIDAKALWKELIETKEYNKSCDAPFTVNMGINQAIGLLNMLPAADVAEVVRCKDCKHWDKETGWCTEHSSFIDERGVFCHPWESANWKMFYDNDYCSYGERKEQ